MELIDDKSWDNYINISILKYWRTPFRTSSRKIGTGARSHRVVTKDESQTAILSLTWTIKSFTDLRVDWMDIGSIWISLTPRASGRQTDFQEPFIARSQISSWAGLEGIEALKPACGVHASDHTGWKVSSFAMSHLSHDKCLHVRLSTALLCHWE